MAVTALILNPSHRRAARAEAALRRLAQVRTYRTTPDSPGTEQTRQAIADGCEAVVAAGGDGTVRLVAGALAGTGIPLGVLPTGTACIYARNLRLPRGLAATKRAMFGRPRAADIGWASIDDAPPTPFLVACGMGRDAEAISRVSAQLKRRFGWVAYAIAGFRTMPRKPLNVAVNGKPVAAWSVLVGNVGRVPFVQLFPGSRIDDAQLHGVRIWPERIGHWLRIAARCLLRDPRPTERMERWQTTEVTVQASKPTLVHIDGDRAIPARTLRLRLQPGAIVVRC
ncbi:MAG: diacylglycerol kinase family protein [Propionibacteriaceae bacterium]|nr:diacylglycerol kinase family protein [Propionibacteriaceae bacterium]